MGRGLDKLLGGGEAKGGGEAAAMTMAVDALKPGSAQPRRRFNAEELQSLSDSIRQQGVVQPLVVRPRKDGGEGGEIVAGERRWRAAQMAGLKKVPVVWRALSDSEAMTLALVENIQRADLNAVEQARGLSRLVEELGMTHAAAAASVGMSRAAVTNLLRLLSLCPPALRLLSEGKIDAGHARAILPLPPSAQRQAAQTIAEKKLSARAAEQLAKTLSAEKEGGGKKTPKKDADTRRLESELSSLLKAQVQIRHRPSGDGRLVIRYASLNSLDKILAKLRK